MWITVTTVEHLSQAITRRTILFFSFRSDLIICWSSWYPVYYFNNNIRAEIICFNNNTRAGIKTIIPILIPVGTGNRSKNIKTTNCITGIMRAFRDLWGRHEKSCNMFAHRNSGSFNVTQIDQKSGIFKNMIWQKGLISDKYCIFFNVNILFFMISFELAFSYLQQNVQVIMAVLEMQC